MNSLSGGEPDDSITPHSSAENRMRTTADQGLAPIPLPKYEIGDLSQPFALPPPYPGSTDEEPNQPVDRDWGVMIRNILGRILLWVIVCLLAFNCLFVVACGIVVRFFEWLLF
jgi:hypothetical protein